MALIQTIVAKFGQDSGINNSTLYNSIDDESNQIRIIARMTLI